MGRKRVQMSHQTINLNSTLEIEILDCKSPTCNQKFIKGIRKKYCSNKCATRERTKKWRLRKQNA